MRCPVVVGRDEELAALAEIFSRAAGGGGACVVITGEAGLVRPDWSPRRPRGAREQGHVVLAGRSTPTDRVSPLRPLGEALLDGLRRRPPDDPALAPYLPALGTLVPHWAAGPAFPAVPAPPVALAEAMLRILRWLSPERGAVLVLEDMHWDRETLAVLEYLADHVTAFPVAVVLTARSDEPGASGLGSAVTRDAAHLHLAPLADSEVAALAAACLGVDTAPAAIMAGLRPEVDAGLPGQVSSLPPPAVADAITAARARGLLTPVNGRLAYRHALIRELVLAQLDHLRRAELCRRPAETLEASDPGVISERLGELWIQGGEPRWAVEALRRAGRAARAVGATAAAETLVLRALAVAPTDLAGAVRLELLELLAVADVSTICLWSAHRHWT